MEDQFDPVAGEQGGIHLEDSGVIPVHLVDPLHFPLVGAVIRVGDDAIGHQVGMDGARHGGRQPGGVAVPAKLPVVVEGDGLHGVGRLRE